MMETGLLSSAMQIGKVILSSPAVQGVVSSLITTLFIRRGEDIKAMSTIKAKDFENITQELLNNGKLSYVELYKCRNFLNIAKKADEVIANYQEKVSNNPSNAENVSNNKLSFDWLMRFFDAVGNISNDDLQQLWGKVLAGEISQPKSCSLRTLDMIRNMSPEEAKTFSTLCQYVMKSGDTLYIDATGFFCKEDGYKECYDYIKRLGLSYGEHITPLLEAGALSLDHDLAIYIDVNTNLEIHNDKLFGVVMGTNEDPILFQREAYFLTTSGKELFQIIRNDLGYEAEKEYNLLCLKEIKKQNPEFYVGAFSLSEGEMNIDLLQEE